MNNKDIFKNPAIKTSAPFKSDQVSDGRLATFAGSLENFIKAAIEQQKSDDEHALVLCIDSEWGYGKTTFVDMWGQKLIDEDYVALKFDAWKFDHTNELDFYFIGEIAQQLNYYAAPETLMDKLKKLSSTIKPLLYGWTELATISAALCAASYGVPPEFAQVIKSTVNPYIDEIREDYRKTIEDFQNELKNFVKNKKQPIYFFIDELDRCNPLFAIKLLEIIKHLFNVKGVCFILTMNKGSLTSTIEKVYGLEKNTAAEYVERFLDYSPLQLPQPNLKKYATGLFKSELGDALRDIESLPISEEVFAECCIQFDFNLREIQKIIRNLRFFLSNNIGEKKVHEKCFPVVIWLMCLQFKPKTRPAYEEIIAEIDRDDSSREASFDKPPYAANAITLPDPLHSEIFEQFRKFILAGKTEQLRKRVIEAIEKEINKLRSDQLDRISLSRTESEKRLSRIELLIKRKSDLDNVSKDTFASIIEKLEFISEITQI